MDRESPAEPGWLTTVLTVAERALERLPHEPATAELRSDLTAYCEELRQRLKAKERRAS
jgi:hypothetical protein